MKDQFSLSFPAGQVFESCHSDGSNLDHNFSVLIMISNVLQMTTAIAIEDVRREVKILRALTGHKNLVQFYDAYEDEDNVYIVME